MMTNCGAKVINNNKLALIIRFSAILKFSDKKDIHVYMIRKTSNSLKYILK